MKIAVFETDAHEPLSIFDCAFASIYSDQTEDWSILDRIKNPIQNVRNISGMRSALAAFIQKLNGSAAVVAREIPGAACSFFEDAGIKTVPLRKEFCCLTDSLLNSIKEQLLALHPSPCEGKGELDQDVMFYYEQEKNTDNFYLNMRDVLLKKPGLTSKTLLQPFFENAEFHRLLVVCDHIPRWFENGLSQYGLQYETVNELPETVSLCLSHLSSGTEAML